MALLGDQADVTSATPLKVKRMDDASSVVDVAGETVTFQYNNSGVLAAASAQPAGTLIYAKLAFDSILDAFKESAGGPSSTSFAFVTGTVLTTEGGGQLQGILHGLKKLTIAQKFTEVAKYLTTNGEFYVDHDEGSIWGLAAATAANDTANYSYKAPVTSSAGPAAAVTATGNVAHDAVDSGNPVKTGGKAQDPTALPVAVVANDRADHMTDLYGRPVVYLGTTLDPTNDKVGVTPRDHSNINTSAYAASLVVKASAGKAFDVRGYNSLASAQFIQVHDAASLPADTAVPEETFTVPASSNFSITFPEGKSFATGIVVCNSSTGPTKTIGAADCWFSVDFE